MRRVARLLLKMLTTTSHAFQSQSCWTRLTRQPASPGQRVNAPDVGCGMQDTGSLGHKTRSPPTPPSQHPADEDSGDALPKWRLGGIAYKLCCFKASALSRASPRPWGNIRERCWTPIDTRFIIMSHRSELEKKSCPHRHLFHLSPRDQERLQIPRSRH